MTHYIGKVYNLGNTLAEAQKVFNEVLKELEKVQKEYELVDLENRILNERLKKWQQGYNSGCTCHKENV